MHRSLQARPSRALTNRGSWLLLRVHPAVIALELDGRLVPSDEVLDQDERGRPDLDVERHLHARRAGRSLASHVEEHAAPEGGHSGTTSAAMKAELPSWPSLSAAIVTLIQTG